MSYKINYEIKTTFFFFETGSQTAQARLKLFVRAEDDLELLIHLSPPSQFQDHRHTPPHTTL